MNLPELLALAVALSMDAFAVAMCAGLAMRKFTFTKALIIGLYFGLFQAIMPLIGYFAASLFADTVSYFDHWLAFVLLSFLGCKMIYGALKTNSELEATKNTDFSVSPLSILPLAIATSIDALAVGVTFALNQVNLIVAVVLIGISTFLLSSVGVKLGSAVGAKLKTKAEVFGGLVLILIGLRILLSG